MLRKISQTSDYSLTLEQELQEQEFMWQRTHSLSNTQKVLDDAIRDLEEYIAEDLANLNSQRRYSSNDSAMGGSEAVVSPMQLDSASEPSTMFRKRPVQGVDSAFSNYSSPSNSSEGVHHTDVLSVGSADMTVTCNHIRMSSGASNSSAAASPIPRLETTESTVVPISSPHQTQLQTPRKATTLSKIEASSLPILDRTQDEGVRSHSHTPPPQASQHGILAHASSSKKGRHKTRTLPSKGMGGMGGTYSHQRSPILTPKDNHICNSESQLNEMLDHTPTESITTSPSRLSLDSSQLQGTVI